MEKIDLSCPYCGKGFQVDSPIPSKKAPRKKLLKNLSNSLWWKKIIEVLHFEGLFRRKKIKSPSLVPTELPVMCLPYTRDIGKFDPKTEEDILSTRRWSRIGKDYLSFINFERFGILRITQKNINVQYRVQKCIECGDLFDVFVNFTTGKTLEKIWPHLFSRDAGSDGLKLYKGENLTVRYVRSFGELVKSKFIAVFLFSLLIFVLGWFPYFAGNHSQSCAGFSLLGFRLSDFMRHILEDATNPNLTLQEFGLYNCDTVLTVSTFVLYGFASFGVMLLLMYFENYLSYLQNSKDFEDLFRLQHPKVGVTFWKNYIISRFVGVQRIGDDSESKNKSDRQAKFFPQATQSDIFAGGIALILALASWTADQNKSHQFIDAINEGNLNLVLFFVFELIIWLTIIYFLSISIFLSLSLTSYVLNGVRKIPMNITPYDNFSSAKPLNILESYAVNIMLVCFIVILLVLSLLQMVIDIQWVLVWFELAVAFLFIAVGLGSSRNEYIVGAILYLLLLYGLDHHTTLKFVSLGFDVEDGVIQRVIQTLNLEKELIYQRVMLIVDLRILVLGFFLTSALAFQLHSADQYINNLLIKSKTLAIKAQKKQLDLLQKNLDSLNERIIGQNSDLAASNKLLNDYQSQRYSVLSSIDTTIRMIGHLEKIDIKRNLLRNATKALTPLVTALALSIAENVIFNYFGLN